MQQVLGVKIRKKYHYYYFHDLLCHNESKNQHDGQLSTVTMVIPPMQSIGGNDDHTTWIDIPSILESMTVEIQEVLFGSLDFVA